MAHVQKLPDHALDAIAKQVGKLYPVLDNSVTQVQPSAALTETFPIWTLPTDTIDTSKDNLLELAQDTHRWHSQILIGGKPEGVARSIVLDGDVSGWSVKQVLKGDLAQTVDDAIRWVDAEVETDPLVCILEVPTFFITALWLIDGQESSIVIAKCPESLQELDRLVQYSSQEFLEALRRESPAIGIRSEHSHPSQAHTSSASQRNPSNVLSMKLLRVLKESEIRRVGGTKQIPVRVRVLTATNIDLREAVAAGRFRRDIYERLKSLHIQLPALWERRENIPALAKYLKCHPFRNT